jgi:hypothetical protein
VSGGTILLGIRFFGGMPVGGGVKYPYMYPKSLGFSYTASDSVGQQKKKKA